MNVKCPNCRFKFDVNQTDTNEKNEVNCTCPRCGMPFTCQYIAPSSNSIEESVQPPTLSDIQMRSTASEDQEADLYYIVMKRMKEGQHEEAGIYLEKLLALKPDEPIYRNIKERLDGIKRAYLLATKYLSSGQLNLAKLYINDLLQFSPDEPLYLSLKDELDKAQDIEIQKQEKECEQKEKHQDSQTKTQKESNHGCLIICLVLIVLLFLLYSLAK